MSTYWTRNRGQYIPARHVVVDVIRDDNTTDYKCMVKDIDPSLWRRDYQNSNNIRYWRYAAPAEMIFKDRWRPHNMAAIPALLMGKRNTRVDVRFGDDSVLEDVDHLSWHGRDGTALYSNWIRSPDEDDIHAIIVEWRFTNVEDEPVSISKAAALEVKAEEARNSEEIRLLRLLREYHIFYTTQTKLGGNHHHPIWVEIAELLAARGVNNERLSADEWKYITAPHFSAMSNMERIED